MSNSRRTGIALILLVLAVAVLGLASWSSDCIVLADPVQKDLQPTPMPLPAVMPSMRKVASARAEMHEPIVMNRKPVGVWVRNLAGLGEARFDIREHRLYGTLKFAGANGQLTLEFDADYSVNQENVLFGVISGVDTPLQTTMNLEVAAGTSLLTDLPFCFRFRVDSEFMTIKDLHVLSLGIPGADLPGDVEEFILLQGRYTRDKP